MQIEIGDKVVGRWMPEREVGTHTTLRPGKQPLAGALKPHPHSFLSLAVWSKGFYLKDPLGKNWFRNLSGAWFGNYAWDENGL